MRKSIVLRGRRVAYELERKRVRRISLRIRPDGTPAVSAPPLTPTLLIEKLLLSRGDWILAQLERREAEAAQRENAVYLWGEHLPLRLRQGGRASAAPQDGALLLTLKDPADAEEKRRVLEAWQKKLCAARVTARRGLPEPQLPPHELPLGQLPPAERGAELQHPPGRAAAGLRGLRGGARVRALPAAEPFPGLLRRGRARPAGLEGAPRARQGLGEGASAVSGCSVGKRAL